MNWKLLDPDEWDGTGRSMTWTDWAIIVGTICALLWITGLDDAIIRWFV